MAKETFMEATELHFEMTVRNSYTHESWNEKLEETRMYDEPKNNDEAIACAKQILKDFNADLRPGEYARELLNVQRVETKVIDLIEQKID